MKILHIISSSGMYGAESVILNLCRRLNEESHQNLVGVLFTETNPHLELHCACQRHGVESYLIPCNRQLSLGAIRRIRELASSTAADLVHAHGYKADVFVHLALRRTRLSYVATCHNWLDNDWRSRLYGYIDRWVLRRYSRIASVSDEVRQRLCRSGVDPGRIELIRNGIDMQIFHPNTPRGEAPSRPCIRIGFVGRLSWEKGPDIFVQAANEVLRHHRGVKFVLAGDGPDRATLRALIDRLKISEDVSVLGYVEDTASFYNQLDILVLASRREGLPMAVLEGMANGLSVIATSVGDVPKVIDDGLTGLLVLPGDPQLLAQAILDLVENPSKRIQLGDAARQVVKEHFASDRMAQNYLDFYAKVTRATQHAGTNNPGGF